jgi:hypothetical protein
MSKGPYPQLRSYLSYQVNQPQTKSSPLFLGGCLASPVVLGVAAFAINAALGWIWAILLTLFLVVPVYGALLGFLYQQSLKPKTAEQKAVASRRTAMEALRAELKRKGRQDRTLLTLLEACVASQNRVRAALDQPIWGQAKEAHWVEWRARAASAANEAMLEAIDQSSPFMFGTPFPEYSGNLDAESFPDDLHPAYRTVYRLAVEMKRLANEVERQTRELQTSTVASRGVPSEDRIRDVLEDLAHLRQAQDELNDPLQGRS